MKLSGVDPNRARKAPAAKTIVPSPEASTSKSAAANANVRKRSRWGWTGGLRAVEIIVSALLLRHFVLLGLKNGESG